MPSADEAEHPPPLRQILLPVDGTPNSEVMVDWALSEFCRKGDQINLLHVIPKCVVHYELPLDSIRPRVYARAPRTPRLSSDRNRARGSERDDDTRHPIASSARRYAPSSTMYGFEEYVIDVPDPEQVASSDVHLSHFRTKRETRNLLRVSLRLIISVSLRYRERNSLPFLEPDLFLFDAHISDTSKAQEAAWRADAERYLARKVFPKIERAGFRYTSEVVAYETDTTSVGEIVCERAADSDAVAVVMAAQGKGRVREFFVGSVTNYCLHRCAKPVVVFRAPAKAAEQRRGARDGEEAKELPDAEASRDEAKKDLGLKSGEKRADDAPKSAALFF